MEAETQQVIEALDSRVQRRNERRDMFKMVLGTAVGASAFAYATSASAQAAAAPTEADVLNFALNLEYLEAQFYAYAFTGTGLGTADLGGVTTTGARGDVILTGTAPPRAVNFAGEPVIQQYAREIYNDELAHVRFLRTALSTAAVAQPTINITGGLNADGTPGPFTAAARTAGVVTPSGANGAFLPTDIFDPYASANNFLLGSFIFEDVGVTAYKGASILLNTNAFLDAAAGILAVEAFHAGIIRGALYRRGIDANVTPAPAGVQNTGLRGAADRIAAARDLLDGTAAQAGPPNLFASDDQGISPVQTALTTSAGTTTATASNFVPTDANGIAYSRTAQQVLNVVYLTRSQVTLGGFFPAGVNGGIRTSSNAN